MHIILKIIIRIVIIAIVLFALFVLYITLVDYKPATEESIFRDNNAKPVEKDTFNLISWNIGYAGLGAEMDFFYDEGKKVRPTSEQNQKYLKGIKSFIKSKTVDFWLLQEIDIKSKRSYKTNQFEQISEVLQGDKPFFTINYKVPYVPVPLHEPMGSVKGGMASFSNDDPSEVMRFAYPLIASWLNRLFLLDRCFILTRIPVDGNKDLVILNTHNSAYVYDSALRNQELHIIIDKMIDEYAKGNYVIAGGDWNANPPGFRPKANFNGHRFIASQVVMNDDRLPENWSWAFDPSAPTNRNNNKAFVKGENGTTCLDYFMVSPNVEVLQVKTIDLEFKNSDHNPVYLEVRLMK